MHCGLKPSAWSCARSKASLRVVLSYFILGKTQTPNPNPAQAGIKPEALTSTEAICKMFNSTRLSKVAEPGEEEKEEEQGAMGGGGGGDGGDASEETESVTSFASTAFTASTSGTSLLHIRPAKNRSQFLPSWFNQGGGGASAGHQSKLHNIEEARLKEDAAEEEEEEEEEAEAESPDLISERRSSLSSLRFLEPLQQLRQLQLASADDPRSPEKADGAASTSNALTPTPTTATLKTPEKATMLTLTLAQVRAPSELSVLSVRERAQGQGVPSGRRAYVYSTRRAEERPTAGTVDRLVHTEELSTHTQILGLTGSSAKWLV